MDRYTQPEYANAAIITIDIQCDTLDGQPYEIPGTSAILPKVRSVLEVARRIHLPIVHIVRIYKRDGTNVDLCRREMIENGFSLVLEGSSGSQIAPDILPNPDVQLNSELLLSGHIQSIADNEVIVYKPRWGAFYQTPLESHLQSLGVSTAIFMGCNFPNCPRTSIVQACERDYRVVVVADAVSGLYERGKQEMANIGVALPSTDELIKKLEALVVTR